MDTHSHYSSVQTCSLAFKLASADYLFSPPLQDYNHQSPELRTDEINGREGNLEGDEEEEGLDDEEDDDNDDDDDEVVEEEEEEAEIEEEEKTEENEEKKENVSDEKRSETEEQKNSITEPNLQKKEFIKEVPDRPTEGQADPASLLKDENQSEKNRVKQDKPKNLFGSRNRLSLFKRSSTTSSGKPQANSHPENSQIRESESSSSELQTGAQNTGANRSHSAACNLL